MSGKPSSTTAVSRYSLRPRLLSQIITSSSSDSLPKSVPAATSTPIVRSLENIATECARSEETPRSKLRRTRSLSSDISFMSDTVAGQTAVNKSDILTPAKPNVRQLGIDTESDGTLDSADDSQSDHSSDASRPASPVAHTSGTIQLLFYS